jgi:hypothetical protein
VGQYCNVARKRTSDLTVILTYYSIFSLHTRYTSRNNSSHGTVGICYNLKICFAESTPVSRYRTGIGAYAAKNCGTLGASPCGIIILGVWEGMVLGASIVLIKVLLVRSRGAWHQNLEGGASEENLWVGINCTRPHNSKIFPPYDVISFIIATKNKS